MNGLFNDTKSRRNDRIGETKLNSDGLKMTIVEYNNANDLDVKFEDGYIARHKTYVNFNKGAIKNKGVHVGETNVNKNGETMTIVAFRNLSDVDIKFEDGSILYNKMYSSFTNGTAVNPNLRVGEKRLAANGQVMTIVRYRKAIDLDIEFEDGTIVCGKSYNNFKKGYIENPNNVILGLSPQEIVAMRTGLSYTNKDGIDMTIETYRSASDIDVRLSSGELIPHTTYDLFTKGEVAVNVC